MAFQKLRYLKESAPCCGFVQVQYETDENGKVKPVLKDLCSQQLPSSETTDLKTMLEAGVNIQQVDTRFMSNKELLVDKVSQISDDDFQQLNTNKGE